MATAMPEPRVGDEVLIRATVKKVTPTVGVLVELFSKTEQYPVWIRPDEFADVVLPDMPDEPADGTWLHGIHPHTNTTAVFRRDDAEGHNDPDRRHDRRWWDVVAGEWIDWPTAVRRGADTARVLREETIR